MHSVKLIKIINLVLIKIEGGTQTYFFYNFFSVIYSVNLNTMKYNY